MSIGVPTPIVLVDLGGGLNEQPAAGILDSEFAELENFYTLGKKIVRRKGVAKLTDAAWTQDLTGLVAYRRAEQITIPEEDRWLLLAGARDAILRLDGALLTPLTNLNAALPLNDNPWHFRQFEDEVFGVRKQDITEVSVGNGRLKRVNQANFGDAGIAAPPVGPTVVDGAAGLVEAGNYYYVVTYYNSLTGAESNPSPASAVLAHAGGFRVTVTIGSASADLQVDKVRIYRTLPNQTGEYYFVDQVANGTALYDDNKPLDSLGRTVSFSNGLPPGSLEGLEVFEERMWLHDGKSVFFSPIGLPQSYDPLDVIPAYKNDGHKIVALCAHGTQLMIPKTNAIHYVTGFGRSSFDLQTLSHHHGCAAGRTFKSVEGFLFWLAEDNVYASDGSSRPVAISTPKVRRTLDAIPAAQRALATAWVVPSQSLYVLSIPGVSDSVGNVVMLAYNWKSDSWATFRQASQLAPSFVLEAYDNSYAEVHYAIYYDGHVYQWNTGRTDNGTLIPAFLTTKAFQRGGKQLGVRTASILCPAVLADVSLQVYNDGGVILPSTPRDVSLDRGDGWKDYNLSSMGRLASEVQLHLSYIAEPDLEIEGLAINAMAFDRRRKAA